MRECLRGVWPVALTVSILCLAAVAAWIVVNSMNACLLCVSLACIYENALVDPPFAFTIHFVLAERYVLELILNTGLVDPATNIVIRCPPEQIRDK